MTNLINLKKKLLVIPVVFKWHFKHYILKKDFPLIAGFQLTNICNLKCEMCNIWKNKKKNTIPLNLFKNYIDDLSKMGCCYISLSGGEPLIIKDIEDYVSYAKLKIPIVNLTTNGFLLDKEIISKLKKTKVDSISISIDALKKKHDKIRGIPGSFDKCIEAINNLKNHSNIQIVVNTVISPWNIDDLPDLIKLVENLKIHHKFQPINQHPPYGNPEIKKINWETTPDFINKLNKIIKELKQKKTTLNSNYFLSAIPTYFLNKNIKGLFNENCKLIHYYCDITEDSKIFPCLNGIGAKNGVSIEKDLKKAYQSKNYKELQKNLIKCRYCQKNLQICHMEPRISFPFKNYIKYGLLK